MASLSQHYAASAAFHNLKVNELKEVCIGAGLPRTGRKADLQQRILLAMRHGNRVQQALEQLLGGRQPVSSSASLAPLVGGHKPLMGSMPAASGALLLVALVKYMEGDARHLVERTLRPALHHKSYELQRRCLG